MYFSVAGSKGETSIPPGKIKRKEKIVWKYARYLLEVLHLDKINGINKIL